MRTAVLLFGLVAPLSALATPAGISGFSGKGGSSICSSCHTGGAAATVTLTGPATLITGQTGDYTATVTGGPGVNAGIDVALGGANSGSATFTAGPGSKLLNGELVHSASRPFAAGSASFTFSVKAPLTAGPFTLSVAGLSSNDDNDPGGDGAAMGALTVTVGLTGGAAPDAGAPDAGSGPPTPNPMAMPAPAPVANGNHYNGHPESKGVVEGDSGCSSSGGMPMVLLAALVGGALLARARRVRPAPPRR